MARKTEKLEIRSAKERQDVGELSAKVMFLATITPAWLWDMSELAGLINDLEAAIIEHDNAVKGGK